MFFLWTVLGFQITWTSSTQVGLKLKTTESTKSTSYMDCLLEMDNSGKLSTKLYDFDFPIVNVPSLFGNVPASPAYGVFVSQLVRYARACTLYGVFFWEPDGLPRNSWRRVAWSRGSCPPSGGSMDDTISLLQVTPFLSRSLCVAFSGHVKWRLFCTVVACACFGGSKWKHGGW